MFIVIELDFKELKDFIVELKLGQVEMKGQFVGIDNCLIRLEIKMEIKLDILELLI